MNFSSEKDKEFEDTRSSMQSENESTQLPETAVTSNHFQSPYIPKDTTEDRHPSYEAPRAIPSFVPPPTNLVSPYNPHANHISSVGSPYAIPASVASPFQPTQHLHHSTSSQSYSQGSHASYSNIPLVDQNQHYSATTSPYPYSQQPYPSAPTYQEYPIYH